jgi:predicted ester cyclase
MVSHQIFQQIRKSSNNSFTPCGEPFLISEFIFEDIIIEGNKVAGRYYLNRTHKGEFLDLRPTDKQFKVNGMTIISFSDEKIMERWNLVYIILLKDQLKTKS